VAIGGAFFGESMFNLIPNASKVAFYFLVEHLRKKDFFLLDSQFINDFTKQLGAIEIPRGEYLALLNYATKLKKSFV
jgi:leucyl/phenylalanyl-tRNA--protein transferase